MDHGGQILKLQDLRLDPVAAHGGTGLIGFCRVFARDDLRSACNFVDYAVVPPGASIGRHTHGDNEELYLVLEGEELLHLDGREVRVGPGAVVLNRQGGTHGLRNDGSIALRLFVVEVALRAPSS